MAYIDKEKAIDKILSLKTSGAFTEDFKNEVLKAFEQEPSDVELVVHALWEFVDITGFGNCTTARCSHCKKTYGLYINGNEPEWKRCPECGAKMDGLIPPPNHFCSYGVKKECADQKTVTNFECFKKNIAKMSIDELAKVIKDSDNCEKFCVFTKDGRCDSRGDADVCEIGVKRYLESEATE